MRLPTSRFRFIVYRSSHTTINMPIVSGPANALHCFSPENKIPALRYRSLCAHRYIPMSVLRSRDCSECNRAVTLLPRGSCHVTAHIVLTVTLLRRSSDHVTGPSVTGVTVSARAVTSRYSRCTGTPRCLWCQSAATWTTLTSTHCR